MRFLVTLTLLGLAAVRGSAQDVLLEPLDRQPRPVYAADGLLATDKRPEKIEAGRWRTDIVFGLPIALRAQRQVTDSGIWVEGGAGLYFIFPSVFAGVRFDGRIYEGPENCVYARPGVDVYYSPIRAHGGWLFRSFNGIGVVAVDTDLTWQHKWTDRVHGNLGVKVGLGVGVAGGAVFPVPLLGLTCGLRY